MMYRALSSIAAGRCGAAMSISWSTCDLSFFVEDASFFVGDEEDYIDEFSIRSGVLYYRRVHQGYWWDVEDYLARRRSPQSRRVMVAKHSSS